MKKIVIVLLVCFMAMGCDDNESFSPEQDPGSQAASLGDGIDGTVLVEVTLDLNSPQKTRRARAGERKKPEPESAPKQPVSAQPDKAEEGEAVAASSDLDREERPEERAVVETPEVVDASLKDSDSGLKADIFFYLGHKKVGKCWSYVSSSIEKSGFLSHINKNLDWQLSVAFASHDPKLYKFRRHSNYYLARKKNFFGGPPISVLKKKDIGGYYGYKSLGETDESLAETIGTEYYRRSYYDTAGGDIPPLGKPVFGSHPPEDPLSGLTRLIERNPRDFIRGSAKTFVVLFEYGNYRYTQQEWENFSRAHEGIHFISLSSPDRGGFRS